MKTEHFIIVVESILIIGWIFDKLVNWYSDYLKIKKLKDSKVEEISNNKKGNISYISVAVNNKKYFVQIDNYDGKLSYNPLVHVMNEDATDAHDRGAVLVRKHYNSIFDGRDMIRKQHERNKLLKNFLTPEEQTVKDIVE